MTPEQRHERKRLARAWLSMPGAILPLHLYRKLLYWAEDNRCCPLFGHQYAFVPFEDIEGCDYQRPQYPVWRNELAA